MSNILLLLPTRILKQDDCMTEILFPFFFSSYINSWAYQPIEYDVFLKSKFSENIFNLDLLNSILMPWNFLLILFIDKLNGHKKSCILSKKKRSIVQFQILFLESGGFFVSNNFKSDVVYLEWLLIPNFQNSTVLKSFINTKYPFV